MVLDFFFYRMKNIRPRLDTLLSILFLRYFVYSSANTYGGTTHTTLVYTIRKKGSSMVLQNGRGFDLKPFKI